MIQHPPPTTPPSFAEVTALVHSTTNHLPALAALHAAPAQPPRVHESIHAAIGRQLPLATAALRVMGSTLVGAGVGHGFEVATFINPDPAVFILLGAATGLVAGCWWTICPRALDIHAEDGPGEP